MSRPKTKKRGALLELPPLPHADAHRRLIDELSRMTAAELFQTLVDAGIYTKDGKLTKPYRTPRDAASAAR